VEEERVRKGARKGKWRRREKGKANMVPPLLAQSDAHANRSPNMNVYFHHL